MRSSRRDPWQPIGNALSYLMLAALTLAEPYRREREPLTRDYAEDPEPRWLYCLHCDRSTIWEPYRWVLDGDTDYECTDCGAVA